jgi:hypothetical protein
MVDKSNGVLFVNQGATHPKAPQYRGNIEISRQDLQYLIEQARAGAEIKLELGAWVREGPKAGKFLSINAQQPFRQEAEAQPAPQPQPAPQAAPQPAPQAQPAPPTEGNPFGLDDEIPFS